jgi:hypothetical protein
MVYFLYLVPPNGIKYFCKQEKIISAVCLGLANLNIWEKYQEFFCRVWIYLILEI